MFAKLREQFSTAGLILSILALIFALAGGAYAANHSGKATASAKGAKGPRGPKGAKGATGAPGPQGLKGDPGPAGKDGALGPEGKQGPAGNNGTNGKSVTVSEVEAGNGEEQCEERGGARIKGGSSTAFACNGVDGSPWTAGGTLPPGSSEHGTWVAAGEPTEGPPALSGIPQVSASVSFNVPLAAGVEAHVIPAGTTTPPGCTGSVSEPGAAPGNLCLFARFEKHVFKEEVEPGVFNYGYFPLELETGGLFEAGKSGTVIVVRAEEPEGEPLPPVYVAGDWAVTAPAAP